jgi:hypothetical protein
MQYHTGILKIGKTSFNIEFVRYTIFEDECDIFKLPAVILFRKLMEDERAIALEKHRNKNENIDKEKLSKILSCNNSYLGILRQYKTYNLRQKLLTNQFILTFWKFFKLAKNKDKYLKVCLNQKIGLHWWWQV